MSNSVLRTIAPAGYVRACFSKRLRGHCLPLELVRRHLGAVNRGEFRRRLAREFAGYLVTDASPVLRVWRGLSGRVVVLGGWVSGDVRLDCLMDGFGDFERGACLDAVAWLPSGGCCQYLVGDVVCAVVGSVARGGVFA